MTALRVRRPVDAVDRQAGPALLVELALDDLDRLAGRSPDRARRCSFAQVVVADDPRGGQAVGCLERLDRLDGRGAEDAVDRRSGCRARGAGPGSPGRRRRGCRGSGSGRRRSTAGGRGPGAVAASSEQGEGDRQEAADQLRHGRQPSDRSGRRAGPAELVAARRIGAGATAGDGGHLDGEPDRRVDGPRAVGQGRPAELRAPPSGRGTPPPKASPAPTVSTTATAGTGISRTPVRHDDEDRTPAVGHEHERRPAFEEATGRSDRRSGRREVGEVVDADLDDVGCGRRSRRAGRGRPPGR